MAIFTLLSFLCRYLQEIGYTDTIIDVRSNRVRSLLGLNDENINEDSNGGGGGPPGGGGRMVNGGDVAGAAGLKSRTALHRKEWVQSNISFSSGHSGGQQNTATQRRVTNQGAGGGDASGGGTAGGQRSTSLAQEMLIDTEAAVMANFDFLSSEVS